ncbi:flagellar transcriptional regulator FlhD, partial [Salmonella enterica]|uniref:flagellar transcriptional regulator FlhD n=1 Tax=Salmonella enterica TaxID=28901 RepID=UPI00398C2780
MHTSDLLKHIYDINFSYLLLAHLFIVQDKSSAIFRLVIYFVFANTLSAFSLPLMFLLPVSHPFVFHF